MYKVIISTGHKNLECKTLEEAINLAVGYDDLKVALLYILSDY